MTVEQTREYLRGVARRMGEKHREEGATSKRAQIHPDYRAAYDEGFGEER